MYADAFDNRGAPMKQFRNLLLLLPLALALVSSGLAQRGGSLDTVADGFRPDRAALQLGG